MPRVPRLALLVVLALLGPALATGEARADTSVTGIWRGGGHAVEVSGTLESGFKVIAAESWMIIGCPIDAGTLLTSFAPDGAGTYTATYLWTEATTVQGQEGVQCENSYRSEYGIAIAAGANSVEFTGCGYAFCSTLSRTEPAPDSKPKDTKPPVVQAFDKGLTRRGTLARLGYSVKDNSGRATVHLVLYEGGVRITAHRRAKERATGARRAWPIPMASGRTGPMYFCVWAQDAAGNRSKDAPASDCAWISLIARLEDVSNGCGGAQWGPLWASVQNWFLDGQTYRGRDVRFRMACNIHDAGYGGYTVEDPLHGRIIDFRTWTRSRVDAEFRDDLKELCRDSIKGDSQRARMGRRTCEFGPHLSIGAVLADTPGATAYHEGVRTYAKAAFDADVMFPGTQDFPGVLAFLHRGARTND